MENLTIYRASAGSGKTYTITGEYISLLLRSAGDYHRRILAVTFTNKATEEMKSRIVRDLHKMATRQDEVYIKYMATKTQMPEKELPVVASRVLAHLLHDYSHFSILTIDSFFQKVIRSFAREMGLYAGYEIELDQNSALDEATNLMLDNIAQNDFLKDWLVEWAKRKIEEGKSWNFKSDVLRLGREIFSEELQNIDPKLLTETTDKESLERFRTTLQNMVSNYRDYLQNCGQMAMEMIERYGLDIDSFAHKSQGVGAYFNKLADRQDITANNYVLKALEDVEGWYSKASSQKRAITEAYNDVLGELLHNMTGYQNEHARQVNTVRLILKQINVLGVLCDLMHYVKEYTRDQNLFLLSEASGFIKKIIADADTPFIYERVGNFFNHFMIDEFQDTSSVQWDNFRPLIDNSIASGYHNWIVGDVKQSIYRWRNTDWKILSGKVENDLGAENVIVNNLDKNWRSAPEVIHFNNAFFRQAVMQICAEFLHNEADTPEKDYARALCGELTRAYSDCYQHLSDPDSKEKGYVHLEMIAKEEDDDETWRDKALEKLPQRIEQLQDLGYRLSEIAILVRENQEAQTIADRLLEYRQAKEKSNPDAKYRYDALSNDSLLINNAPVVKWLLAAMRYIIEPDDMINRAYLQREHPSVDEPFDFSENKENLTHESVFEFSEKLIKNYNLYRNTGQAPFLLAFQDILLQYMRREASDIRSFLDWWENEKHKKYVAMPDNQDAIRLITIHKAKGLEFDAVIIPFCDWQLNKAGRTLWCIPSEAPFSDMKLLPLKFEKELRNTIFAKDYLREKMLSYIDNLNLLYVAFTRARKTLFITTPQQEKDGFENLKNLIHRVFYQPLNAKSCQLSVVCYQKMDASCQSSVFCSHNLNDSSCQSSVFSCQTSASNNTATNKYQSMTENYQLKTENYNSTFNSSTPQLVQNFASGSVHKDMGRLLHDIFRKMVTLSDLQQCLDGMIVDGKLPEVERAHITGMVRRALENPTVRRWFAPNARVKTEAEILLPDGSTARPDRIVFDGNEAQIIDYKFGKQISENHRQQVLQYMKHLNKMGYGTVKGFLWYVSLNKVSEVQFSIFDF